MELALSLWFAISSQFSQMKKSATLIYETAWGPKYKRFGRCTLLKMLLRMQRFSLCHILSFPTNQLLQNLIGIIDENKKNISPFIFMLTVNSRFRTIIFMPLTSSTRPDIFHNCFAIILQFLGFQFHIFTVTIKLKFKSKIICKLISVAQLSNQDNSDIQRLELD